MDAEPSKDEHDEIGPCSISQCLAHCGIDRNGVRAIGILQGNAYANAHSIYFVWSLLGNLSNRQGLFRTAKTLIYIL